MQSCFLPSLHQRIAGRPSKSHPHQSANLSYLELRKSQPACYLCRWAGMPMYHRRVPVLCMPAFPFHPKEGRPRPQPGSFQTVFQIKQGRALAPEEVMLCSFRDHRATSSGPSGQHRLHNSSTQQASTAKCLSLCSQHHINTQQSPGTIKAGPFLPQMRKPGPWAPRPSQPPRLRLFEAREEQQSVLKV